MGDPRGTGRTRRLSAARTGVLAAGAALALVALGGDPAAAEVEAYTVHINEVVRRLTRVGQSIAVSFAVLFTVVAGLRWILAGGEPGEIDKSKRAFAGAGMGYLVAFSGEVILLALDYVNGYDA
ncbi:hypothetical protein ACIRPH_11015 [Nocardiopsis sp. NPDC101807]|uniref:hypothetical protein n=1 Tax=Nocardiopsis sp. NPDC101807 TaxID=3364339 RepID=UPI00380063F4